MTDRTIVVSDSPGHVDTARAGGDGVEDAQSATVSLSLEPTGQEDGTDTVAILHLNATDAELPDVAVAIELTRADLFALAARAMALRGPCEDCNHAAIHHGTGVGVCWVSGCPCEPTVPLVLTADGAA